MNEGQFAQVVCIVTEGDEPLTITWSLQGEVVSSEPGLSTTTFGSRTSMLTIQSIGYRHSGTYTCTASNDAGSRAQAVQLKVNGRSNLLKCERKREPKNFDHFYFPEPPVLMPLTFGADVLDEGQFAQVICIVGKGDEPLTISWSLQGEIVSSEPSLTTSSLGTRTSLLSIQSVGYRHSGTYTCTASNPAGSAARSVELKVNGKL